jgi:hypothetical protein
MSQTLRHIRLDQPAHYEIRVHGHLREDWAESFGDMEIDVLQPGGDLVVTRLTGLVPDQPALYGILDHLRDLGLVLLLVRCIDFDQVVFQSEEEER